MMDPPPLPLNLISSPRYRNDEPLPDVPGSKLRLMCSYGGHIMPRPHDKSLSYVGGDTRIVAVDRHSSLKSLCSHLSRTLLHGRPFTLKYHLPNEDLENLITVSTDEDLENMIDEYDRLASKPSPSRLRMFLFLSRPDTAVSMGTLLDDIDASCDTWFAEALDNSGILSRVVSDSAAVDCLVSNLHISASSNDLELEEDCHEETNVADDVHGNKLQVKHNLVDVHSGPGSPVKENVISSGESASLSYSMANLPPIWVCFDHEDGNGNGMRKQDQQKLVMEDSTFGVKGVKQDDGFVISSSSSGGGGGGGGDLKPVVSDDRKPPIPLQIVQPRTGGGFGLPSPDSVASDSSIAYANSFPKSVYYQDLVQAAHVDNKGPTLPMPNNIKTEVSDHGHGIQGDQVQDSSYTSHQQQLDQNQQSYTHHHQQQQQQQQFVYIGTGQVPMSSHYSVYAPPSQQYPVYVMPVGSTQPYNMTLQADPNVIAAASVRPLIPQTSSVASTALYKDATSAVYKAAPAPVASNPAFIQIPSSNQYQQQYVSLPQNIHHPPPQPIAIAPSATSNYGYEYGTGQTQQDQVYFTQQQAPQYQSMTPAAALSDVSKQFSMDNIQQPNNRTSQPV